MEIIATVTNEPVEDDGRILISCSVSRGASQGPFTFRVPFGSSEGINEAIKQKVREEFDASPSDRVTLFGGAV